MCAAIRKKRKTLLVRAIEKIKAAILPDEHSFISPDVSLTDNRISDDSSAEIESRRNELRAATHDNSEVTIFVEDDN